ncbi:MAG TPA: biotin--[acetyl-CoA-carboxylase] ligase [Isosphaeraceae bacterium]|nr:biotin--[acetyl-CoA-carboxylase] ligase [Isosphaeraceae bacterium]
MTAGPGPLNVPLLDRLRSAGGAYVPVLELDPDPGRLRRDLDALDAFGFVLERHPFHGVAYRGPAPRLCPDQIEWELGTRRIGRRIAVWNRVTSTNDLAARAAGSTANDGLVVLAEEQTAGRGRRGRSWSAPPGSSILMSVLLFPPEPLVEAAWLTALGAVAVAEVVEDLIGEPARIKWPNDVRVRGRKVAGVLVERSSGSVLGLGVNACAELEDFPEDLRVTATSLRLLTGATVDRSELARGLIRRLDALYEEGLDRGPGALNAPWRDRLEPIGQPAVAETPTGPVAGRLIDADLRDGLTLATGSGAIRRLRAAEVMALSAAVGGRPPI